MSVARRNDGLQFALLFGQRIEVSIFLTVGRVNLVQTGLRRLNAAQAFFDDFTHGFVAVNQRLLWQVADLNARLRTRLTGEVFIYTGHDFEHGRFARTVEAEQADFRAGEEGQRDVLDDDALGRNSLADRVHGVDVLHSSGLGLR